MAENWSDDELAAAVGAYSEMAGLEAARRPYSKRDIYRDLAQRFGRTEKGDKGSSLVICHELWGQYHDGNSI